MAHLFFSYAHADADRLTQIHAQMQNILEHNLWLDKVGLERGMAWENAIKAAIDDSYGVIFAVTKTFITRDFILQKEIPWAMEKFRNKQGVQLFPILFDDVQLPDLLKTPFITHMIKAFDRPLEEVMKELKRVLPTPHAGTQPFVVNWPRLTNFKGRDAQLIELHQKLMGDGRVGEKMAGLHGTGGIGKTQLAVEYAHRYRYHYPGGVYWLNAGADWRKEVAACAVNIDRTLMEKSDEEKALAFRDFLAAQGKDVLLVLDNVDDPADVTRREIAPRLTITKICEDTRMRLLITTRVQKLPEGFADVSVNVLTPSDAQSVLLDVWESGTRKEVPDTKSLNDIARIVGYLPLALILVTAALAKRPNLHPAKLLEYLRENGIDQIADRTGLEKAGPSGYVSRVDVALEWQVKQLELKDARMLLALLSAFGEAAVIPCERLRLLSGLRDDDLDTPFIDAIGELTDYHLVEPMSEGLTFRLHPLTQQYALHRLDAAAQLIKAVPHLVTAFRNPAILHAQTHMRGFSAIIEDLSEVQRILITPYDNLDELARLLMLEEPKLLMLPEDAQVGYVIQQIRERAHHENDDTLRDACDQWLMNKLHLCHNGLRYPTNKALLRTLSLHTSSLKEARQLKDGRILSWSDDATLRLWTNDGRSLAALQGHTSYIYGAVELADGRILSWSDDATLRLWTNGGKLIATMEGHTDAIKGALLLADGRILSWSDDATLRLWTNGGKLIATMEGHTDAIKGALLLADGRILSWSDDAILKLWASNGQALWTLIGHTAAIRGAVELTNGRILSWSHDAMLGLWTSDGSRITWLEGHNSTISGVVLADGRILSWSYDATIQIWSKEGEKLSTIKGHTDRINGVQIIADGRILSWSDDTTLRLWTNDGHPLATLEGHTGTVNGALLLTNGHILSWSDDTTLRLWTNDGHPLATLEGHTGFIYGALVLVEGYILSWSDDKTLRLWAKANILLQDGDAQGSAKLEEQTSAIRGALVLAGNCILSWSYNTTLQLWTNDGQLITVLKGHTNTINGALVLSDERILSWSADKTLRLWASNGRELVIFKGHSLAVRGAIEMSSGRLLSWSNDKTLRLWTNDGKPIATMEGHTNNIYGVLILSDERILSWSADKTLRLWSNDWWTLKILQGHTSAVKGAIVLTDGRILSWSDDATLRLWTNDGQALTTMQGHTSTINGAIVLTDGRILSWSDDATLRLWTNDGHELAVLRGHSGSINNALSMNNGQLLSSSYDKTVRLWTGTGQALATIKGHTGLITNISNVRNGQILSSADKMIRLWTNDGKHLMVYSGDAPIKCCIMSKDEQTIIAGDSQGRMLFLRLNDELMN